MSVRIHVGDALEVLRGMPAGSVQCCVTSPPYWGLRAYQGDAGMIGLEPTFGEHLTALVAVFREVRRVLRDDGVCFANYGDAYAGSMRGYDSESWNDNKGNRSSRGGISVTKGWKPKDLMMMPARVAMALQADGWWLRSEIVWHKPNPMPESCTDRPTSAHEKLYLLTKAPRYFYDAEAVRVPHTPGTLERFAPGRAPRKPGTKTDMNPNRGKGFEESTPESILPNGANLRNVWSIATHSFSAAHFATFPPALVEPCIKAGTSERGACAKCGAPWRRVVAAAERVATEGRNRAHDMGGRDTTDASRGRAETGHVPGRFTHETTGWEPTCCDCLEIVSTPRPDGEQRDDPTMQTGRKGLNRPRNTLSTRPITRGQQREYAKQIRESPHRDEIRDMAGQAFDHYIRTDIAGARPMPPDLLDECLSRGWLRLVDESTCNCACQDASTRPCVVLDPFGGAGTVGLVADRLQRDAVLIEISAEYAEMARKRIQEDATLLAQVEVVA